MTVAANGRTCGEGMSRCTLCCLTHRPPQYKKETDAALEWCRHCAIGTGCRIFHQPENPYRNWICGWRDGIGEDEERPDKVDIVLSWERTSFGTTLALTAVTAVALDSEYARRITEKYARRGYPVLQEDIAGRKVLVLKNGTAISPLLKERLERGGLKFVLLDEQQ